ncbi:MAG: hypothetical protein KF745_13970 [Phycisphaeraceae bacterium]|nr:hypothetical protein [Phycisphaeraceae bacterium]
MTEPSQPINVLLVGHCGPDAYLLKHAVERAIPGVSVSWANDDESLASASSDSHLVLVNRVLDGSFSAATGHDIVRTLVSASGQRATVMLVSNLAEAQAAAVAAGAHPGIGKADVNSEQSQSRLREAAARAAQARGSTQS